MQLLAIHRKARKAILTALLVVALVASRRAPSLAACNIIPGTSTTFRSSLGSSDRPFAGPGNFVQLRLNVACDATSVGFSEKAEDHVVTVAFIPPLGARNLVVLAADCAELESERARCAAEPGVASVTCQEVNRSGEPIDLEVVTREAERRLRFRFPDTDAVVGDADDDRTLTGPVRIAVSARHAPLPCELANSRCSQQSASLIACIDTLYAVDGTCGTTPDSTFSGFTALPPPNNFQDLCSAPNPPCTGRASEARAAIDDAGNVLVPMDWRGILLGQAVPIARLLRGSTSVAAFPSGDAPVRIPGNGFLRSFSPEGGVLPPLFDPQADPTETNEATLFGSADAPATILRIARRSPTFQECHDGEDAGSPCTTDADCSGRCAAASCRGGANEGGDCHADADCPGGRCGSPLFDFSTRLLDGVGPVTVARFGAGVCQNGERDGQRCDSDVDCGESRCVAYRVVAKDPVPLEALVQSPDVYAFVVPESIEGKDLNGDGDINDDVLTLTDRASGAALPIGTRAAVGRAAVRIHELPFSFPAVAVEGDTVAFLESEPAQGNRDLNGDGDLSDTILRVYRMDKTGGAVDVMQGRAVAVDADARINQRSLAVSQGRVFFRIPEAAGARTRLERASVSSQGLRGDSDSCSPSLSADGRFVAFVSLSTNLVPGDARDAEGVFLRDLLNHTTTRITIDPFGNPLQDDALTVRLSGDSNSVVFSSYSPNLLVPPKLNFNIDVFLRDLRHSVTELVSIAADGSFGTNDSGNIRLDCESEGAVAVSDDGSVVGFVSDAPNLVPKKGLGVTDVFVRDRRTSKTERVSLDLQGNEFAFGADPAPMALSGDGNTVAFSADPQVYVRDRRRATSELVSLSSQGVAANFDGQANAVSAGGEVVAFSSFADNLVPGDTNGLPDLFVRDRQHHATERISISSDGNQANLGIEDDIPAAMSRDGRYVAFVSSSTNLVADDKNDQFADVFRRDRLTGITDLVSQAADGKAADGDSLAVSINADGQVVAFVSEGSNLIPGFPFDPTGHVYVRSADPTDRASDLSGDGDVSDTLLAVLDVTTGEERILCPAGDVAIAGGAAAFLRPEAAGPSPRCPVGADLNGDGDSNDRVVHLWQPGSEVLNLGRAATAVALSEHWVAALVSEAEQGAIDLNGDGDYDDQVVELHELGAPPQSWLNLGQAAERVELVDSLVVFLTPEAAQGADLNGDGDLEDHIIQVFDAQTQERIFGGRAAEEFVTGPRFVAFRTSEASEGHTDLNGDGDSADDVLGLFQFDERRFLNTGQAVLPCQFEACDPRQPYRVLSNTVKFLTFEGAQGEDLNDDGDQADVVLQTFNVPLASRNGSARAGGRSAFGHTRRRGVAVMADSLTTVGSVSAGICTTTGLACVRDADCDGGTCFLPPGGCIKDLGVACKPDQQPCREQPCPPDTCQVGQFCAPTGPRTGTCRSLEGACRSDADCEAPATCTDGGASFQRLVAPLNADGGQLFVAAGRCVETTSIACGACPAGLYCTASSLCARDHGPCLNDSDCPGQARCSRELVVATARDSDGDELADPFDNCPLVANVLQEDLNGNGIGDACESAALACNGDCNGDGRVTIEELVLAVRIALGEVTSVDCVAVDANHDGSVTIEEIMRAVQMALEGCR